MPLERLDILLTQRGLVKSREEAQTLIRLGRVWKGALRLDKPGSRISADEVLEIKEKAPFVSRAGEKLAHALKHYRLSPKNAICLDVGSSTGGFTDCLLKRGAERVFAVDVGKGQLDWGLRQDPRVHVLESTNARYLQRESLRKLHPGIDHCQWLTMDVSFISISKIIPHLIVEFPSLVTWVILFKPQFEVGREHLKKGGIVSNQQAVERALEKTLSQLNPLGLKLMAPPEASPVAGKKKGNVEYLLHLQKTPKTA